MNEYLNSMSNYLDSDEVLTFNTVESIFISFGYEDHRLQMNNVVFEYSMIDGRCIVSELYLLYEIHIKLLLTEQGIICTDEKVDFNDLVTILSATDSLYHNNETDIIENIEETEDGVLEQFVTILDEAFDINPHLTLTIVTHVNELVIKMIQVNVPISVASLIKQEYKDRYKKLDGVGIVSNAIIAINKFGYTIDEMISIVTEDILKLTDVEEIVTEIKLLVLGSNTIEEEIIPTNLIVASILFEEDERLLRILAKLPREE